MDGVVFAFGCPSAHELCKRLADANDKVYAFQQILLSFKFAWDWTALQIYREIIGDIVDTQAFL
jgi:hypothetical protein